jgi:hypothetical protein
MGPALGGVSISIYIYVMFMYIYALVAHPSRPCASMQDEGGTEGRRGEACQRALWWYGIVVVVVVVVVVVNVLRHLSHICHPLLLNHICLFICLYYQTICNGPKLKTQILS